MALPYYLVAYGHTLRVSNRCQGPKAAMKDTYGLTWTNRMTWLMVEGKGWRYRSAGEKDYLMRKLAVEHKQKTGSTIGGYEKSVANVQGPNEEAKATEEVKKLVGHVNVLTGVFHPVKEPGGEILHIRFTFTRGSATEPECVVLTCQLPVGLFTTQSDITAWGHKLSTTLDKYEGSQRVGPMWALEEVVVRNSQHELLWRNGP